MPLVIPEGYYEAAFHHMQLGTTRPAVCTLGLEYDGDDFEGDAVEAVGGWVGLMGKLSSVVSFTKATMRNQIGIVWERAYLTPGGDTGEAAPYNTAYLVKKTTSSPGRANRGRMFLPGVNEVLLDSNGIINGSKITGLQTGLAAMKSTFEAYNFRPTILHNSPTGGGAPIGPTPIAAFAIQNQIATQRRRLRG